ncbi:MAG: RAMP superfamily CRISPR-associated protein [Egibacteraceae bacterium]
MIVTLVTLTLRTEAPWAVAAPEVARSIDRPLSKDGHGLPHVPGSSLAGSLRGHLADGLRERLMGSDPPDPSAGPSDRGEDQRLTPSRLRILGSRVESPDPFLLQQTAVSRRTGAAASKTLRTSQAAPAGAVISVYLRVDGELAPPERRALATWQPVIGGGHSHGQGRARVESMRWGRLDLATKAGLRAWLELGGRRLFERVCETPEEVDPGSHEAWIAVPVRIVDGLLVGMPGSGKRKTPDVVPHRRGGRGDYVVEGSSIKGVLRSRAEFILRSVGADACDSGSRACGSCDACALFGSTAAAGMIGVRAAVIEDGRTARRPHVAIDRVTGGARPELLFSEEVLASGRFAITVDRLAADTPAWAETLLWHVLRDIDDGMVGFGSRTTRGYGTVRLAEPRDRARLAQLPALAAENGRLVA